MTSHQPAILERTCTIAEAAELIAVLTEAGEVPMIWGEPGIGKTDIVRQLGAMMNRPVIEFHAALRETVDLRGIPVADPVTGTTRWFVPDELPREDRDGPEGYLFLDEFPQGSPQMMAALAGLILYGVVGEYRLPKGWRVIAAGNRKQDRSATNTMPVHIRNRFSHIYVVPDQKAWVTWATTNDVAPEAVAFVRHRGHDVMHLPPKPEQNAHCTYRTLTKASKFVHASPAQRMRLFASLIGDGPATEFDGFINLYRSIGTLDDIIKNPLKANVPTEASQKYAVATGLARKATRANWKAIITYANRLDAERQTLLIHDATLRDPSLKETAEYGEWAVANGHLLMA